MECALAWHVRVLRVLRRRYTRPTIMALFGGVLPFGSIFIEMYFIFTSFFNYKFYYVFGLRPPLLRPFPLPLHSPSSFC
jgi:hypothetical protein